MQGICIDTGSTTVLQPGQKYFLFDHGPNNYYVSKFDNAKAHFGSFRRSHFKLVEDEPFEHPGEIIGDQIYYSSANPDQEPYIEPIIEQQPTIQLKRYVARVAKHRNGYNIGDLFIITEKGPNGYYHVYLKDKPAGGPVGSYITNFFEVIMDYDEVAAKTHTRPKIEARPPRASMPLPKPAEAKIEAAAKPKPEKKPKTKAPDGQMDIFDFLD